MKSLLFILMLTLGLIPETYADEDFSLYEVQSRLKAGDTLLVKGVPEERCDRLGNGRSLQVLSLSRDDFYSLGIKHIQYKIEARFLDCDPAETQCHVTFRYRPIGIKEDLTKIVPCIRRVYEKQERAQIEKLYSSYKKKSDAYKEQLAQSYASLGEAFQVPSTFSSVALAFGSSAKKLEAPKEAPAPVDDDQPQETFRAAPARR